MITTTLNRIRKYGPCREGWEKLLKGLGKTQADDEPLPFARIVEINGLEDALWCCRAEPQHAREWRLFAVWCARQVQHLMEDKRSIAVLDVAERHANGQAADEELAAARDAAWEAAREAARAAREAERAAWAAGEAERAARAAREAAQNAAWAAGEAARYARAAGEAARYARAAMEAAWAAREAAQAAAWAAQAAAWEAEREAARDAARAAEREAAGAAGAAQKAEFLCVVNGGEQ